MKPEIITATEAARGLGDLLARVRYRRESFLIQRGRAIVARLEPVEVAGVSGSEAARAWGRRRGLSAREAAKFTSDLRSARRITAKPPKNPWAR